MIVFSEGPDRAVPSASQRDLAAATEAARLLGLTVYTMEPDFERCGDAEGALWHIPVQERETAGLWIGYIPAPERYAAVYTAALARGIRLLNDVHEHVRAMEFDGFYPLLTDLTPASEVLSTVDEIPGAAERLGFPIFVKGVVQSRKARGPRACIAENRDDLERLCRAHLELPMAARGRVVLRRFVPLRHARNSPQGFPLGREYRVFVHRGVVLDLGYYWEGDDPLRILDDAEREAVGNLAREAAERLQVPWLAVDVAQAQTGEWLIIETGDAQFCGVCAVPRLRLMRRLVDAVGSA